MVAIAFQRLQTIASTFNTTIAPGFTVTQGAKFHIPLTFDGFSSAVTPRTVTATTVATAANGSGVTTITGTAGKFDQVRVGDIIDSLTTGTLAARAAVTVACATFQGLSYIVYPHTLDSTTLNVRAGDTVAGTGIGASAVVDRIEYATRRIFVTVASTATGGAITITFQSPARVTAVRTSTAVANPNQIDLDTTAATNGVASTLVILNGAREAVFAVLAITPVGDSTAGRVSINLGVSLLPGSNVVGSADGLNPITHSTLAFTGAGSFNLSGDTFLTDARALPV